MRGYVKHNVCIVCVYNEGCSGEGKWVCTGCNAAHSNGGVQQGTQGGEVCTHEVHEVHDISQEHPFCTLMARGQPNGELGRGNGDEAHYNEG